jgi:putative solute:sodium symporter small subunit
MWRYARPMTLIHPAREAFQRKVRRLTWACLAVWAVVTVVPIVGARRVTMTLWGWPFNFWMAAQGCVLVYLALVIYFAWQVNRWEAALPEDA